MKKKIRIIIAEDEPVILRGIVLTVTQLSSDYEIAALSQNGADALDKIQDLKPDIVITDIKMPVMDGLELIESASKASPHTVFVILTGYAEFEYAKRAMQLQVADYLLKPVDPDALENLLEKLTEQILSNSKKDIHDYLCQNIYRDSPQTVSYNPLTGQSLHLLFIFYGSITSSMYNELTTGSLIAGDRHLNPCDGLDVGPEIQIINFKGNYRNEAVYAIISSPEHNLAARSAAQKIYRSILCEDIFINSILSHEIRDGLDIPSHIRSCYLFAISHIQFGESQFFQNPADGPEETLSVSPNVKELSKLLKPVMHLSDISQFCRDLTALWENSHATLLRIQTELLFVLNKAMLKISAPLDIYPVPAELLASSASYEELYQNLYLELGRLFAQQDDGVPLPGIPHARILAQKVRDYLEQNYTRQISYKDFTDIFGYNEKYLSLIFKEEFGISPSKYILELRLTSAKELMRQNPDMLLKDIARAVGYDDQLYFSRVFKNSEGVSPKSYQKSLSASPKVLERV